MTMENAFRFQSQLTSLMNAVVRAAVVEIVRLVDSNSVALRQELSKSNLENEALKVENESNKKKLHILESKPCLSIAAKTLTVGHRHAVEAGGGKDDFDNTRERGKPCAGSQSQSRELAVQSQTMKKEVGAGLRVVAMEKDGMKVKNVKKEVYDVTEHETPSPFKDEHLCPKVDMVYGKEWSQSLWRDGGYKGGDSDGRTENGEQSPGTSMTQDQVLQRRK